MTKLECLAIDLGIITANDLERHTALQLIMLIIERLNEVIEVKQITITLKKFLIKLYIIVFI